MMPTLAPAEEQKLALPALDGDALAMRLRAAEQACIRPDGSIDYDWMVMHIWLAKCDALRRAYQAVNAADLGELAPGEVFDAHLKPHLPLFEQLLPEVLPLFGEFARTTEIHSWRREGRAASVVADPAFLSRARQAGLPLCEKDLAYAMGPDGPYGREAYQALFHNVVREYAH